MKRQIALAAALVVLVGACGGAVPNSSSPTASTPSAGSTAPAIASGEVPTASQKTAVVQPPSASATHLPQPTGSAFATVTATATATASATATAPATATIPAGAQIDKRIQVGAPVGPRWFASDGQSLWVHEPTSLVRVDLKTSAITGQVPMNSIDYGYVATGAGAVWQTDFDRDTVVRIDPVDGKVTSIPLPVGSAPEGVAVTANAVWVADHHAGAITRVDPATNSVVATIQIGPTGADGPLAMTAGPGGVWVDVPNMGSVVRMDPATNKVGLLVPLAGHVASDGKEVWIGVDPGPDGLPEVVRIDPVSGKIITAVDLDTSGIGDLAVGLGSVWIITDSGLLRIDSATGQIVGRLDIGGDGGNVIVAGGSVWVTADGQPYVLRILPQ
jgi:virginiamycin B lyase